MFFGLFNALTSFQKYINKIIVKKLDIFGIAYFNSNIFLYTKNQKQANVNVE